MKGTTLDNGVLVGEPREGGTALVWKGFDANGEHEQVRSQNRAVEVETNLHLPFPDAEMFISLIIERCYGAARQPRFG